MRLAAIASGLAIVLCVAVFGAILQKAFVSGRASLPAQAAPTDGRASAVMTADAPPPAVAPVEAVSSCAGNPNALGISRVVEIDTTGGPGFGFEHTSRAMISFAKVRWC
jgi:hypothetical protein